MKGQYSRELYAKIREALVNYGGTGGRPVTVTALWLGGESGEDGGTGGPPGLFIGLLPQDKICYDTTEAETDVGSESLLDNLNTMRLMTKRYAFMLSGDTADESEDVGGVSRILLFDSEGSPRADYPATSDGLDSASVAATAGDVVWLPAGTIAGDHTLAASIHYIGQSQWACILTGEITTGVDTTLEVCSVTRTANDGNDLKGIVAGAASGTVKVRAVSVTCTQSGAGDAFAISAEGTGDIEVRVSDVYGNSVGGAGYGAWRGIGAGNVYLYATRTRGSTAECSE